MAHFISILHRNYSYLEDLVFRTERARGKRNYRRAANFLIYETNFAPFWSTGKFVRGTVICCRFKATRHCVCAFSFYRLFIFENFDTIPDYGALVHIFAYQTLFKMQPEQFSYNFFIAKHPIDNDVSSHKRITLFNEHLYEFLCLFIFTTSDDFMRTRVTCETLRFELAAIIFCWAYKVHLYVPPPWEFDNPRDEYNIIIALVL